MFSRWPFNSARGNSAGAYVMPWNSNGRWPTAVRYVIPTVEGMRSPVVFERCMVGQHGIGSHPGSDSHRIGDRCSRVDAGRHRNKELTTYSDESTSPNVLVQKRITRWCRRRHIAIVSSRKLAVREHTVSIDELSNSHLNLSIDIYVGYL